MSTFRRSSALALIAALIVSVGAQCLVGQEMTAPQMACCVGTEHDCGETAVAQDCCQTERPEQEQLPSQIQQVSQPVALLTGATVTLFRTPTPLPFEVDTTPVKASPPPKYVLLATFLI